MQSPPAQMQPLLRVFGEPLIGRSLEIQLRQAEVPGPAFAILTWGTWSPYAVPSGPAAPCIQHIIAPFYTTSQSINASGYARWTTSIPLDQVFVHSAALAWQCIVLGSGPQPLYTNAVRAHVGGGF